MNKIVNAKGKECPVPVIMAKKEIDEGNTRFIVEVDNKIAVENLQRLANSQEYTTSIGKQNGIFRVTFINKYIENDKCDECENILIKSQESKNTILSWAIFVGKDIIGSGNEELGRSLMKMYFYTISEGDDLPKSILFMNDGVKVVTLNEQAIEHLKDLESKGVEILVCGTCLNFYGLQDKLTVGKISNMYDITNAMKEASKVITL